MANSADPDQLASSEANISRSTLFPKQDISGLKMSQTLLNKMLRTICLPRNFFPSEIGIHPHALVCWNIEAVYHQIADCGILCELRIAILESFGKNVAWLCINRHAEIEHMYILININKWIGYIW